jgi:hypothetical protein
MVLLLGSSLYSLSLGSNHIIDVLSLVRHGKKEQLSQSFAAVPEG